MVLGYSYPVKNRITYPYNTVAANDKNMDPNARKSVQIQETMDLKDITHQDRSHRSRADHTVTVGHPGYQD